MRIRLQILFLVCIAIAMIAFTSVRDANQQRQSQSESWADYFWKLSYVAPRPVALADNPAIYPDDKQDTAIETLYLVVLPTQDTAGEKLTFPELNEIVHRDDTLPELNAFFSTSEAQSVQEPVTNAVVTLRGQSTLQADIKSYKIKLQSTQDAWHDQMTLNLNKHAYDDTRIRNKVAFELFEKLPDFTSLRTQLVHLYVKDLSDPDHPAADYVDYGYFTHIEQVNKDYLKAHDLDPAGTIYKAREFEFQTDPEVLINMDDARYDQEAFYKKLQLVTGKGHAEMLTMIEDVNNMNLDFDQVFAKHFNQDNYLTWVAANILLGNYDTQTQNFYLYSPRNSTCWYFLPWDYDGSMQWEISTGYIQSDEDLLVGVANYWNTTIAKRYFQNPEHVLDLDEKINEVRALFNQDLVNETLEKYIPFARQNCLTDPYYLYVFETSEDLDRGLSATRSAVAHHYNLYQQTKDDPMPFFQGDPEIIEEGIHFFWDPSYDLQADRLSYTLQIATDPDFKNVVYEKRRLIENELVLPPRDQPLPGQYFWRVTAIDSEGHTQRSFEEYTNEQNRTYFGLKPLVIEEDVG